MNKKRIGVVSIIGIVLFVLQIFGFAFICLADLIQNKVINEYNMAALIILFVIMLPSLVYYLIATIISIAIDLGKGKSKVKDIIISIAYVIPIIITIIILLFLCYIGARY